MNQQFTILDVITIVSFFVGWENLIENRQQTAQNDVNIANDKQAKYLLREVTKMVDEQNETLNKILEVVRNNDKV